MPLTPVAPGRARIALTLVASLLVALATAAAAHAAPTITVAPTSPVVGQAVTLTATDEAGGAPAALAWGVAGPAEVLLPALPVASFTPSAAGTYAVSLTVPGSEPVTADVVVRADTPPAIAISPAVVEVQEGGSAQFTATATDPDGPVSVGWRVGAADPSAPFDDATGPTLAGEFDASTTVEAQVTGTPGGSATASAQVHVVLPTASFSLDAEEPVLQGREVTLTSTSSDPGSAPPLDPAPGPLAYDWDLPGEPEDDAFDDDATIPVAFTSPGVAEVTLRVRDVEGNVDEVTQEVDVDPGTAPVAAFGFAPVAVLPGLPVTFTSAATDAEDNVEQLQWDFGDGAGFAPGGPIVSHAYAAPGTYAVGHRVIDEAGLADEAFDSVTVTAPPAAAPPAPPAPAVPQAPAGSAAPPVVGTGGAPAGQPSRSPGAAPRPALMAPFPVVRIAGSVFRRSARIRVLSVQLPWGARAEVRCSGRGCPVPVERRSAAARGRGSLTTLRFRRFEGRSLRAGTTLTIRVTKARAIGKFTRFRIRAGRAPSRLDRCVRPGSARPIGCPAA